MIYLQPKISDMFHLNLKRYMSTVQWDQLLIQLNQVRTYEKVLKKPFSLLVNRIFIIRCQVENRILGLKYP